MATISYMTSLAAWMPLLAQSSVNWYDWPQLSLWIQTWAPIIFMGLLVFFLWKTMKLMPRTKPTEIKPESKSAIAW